MTDYAPSPTAKRSLKRILKWTAGSLLVLGVIAIAAYALANYRAAVAIRNEIDRIRASGDPLTFADLDKLVPPAAEAQDAGPYYAAAVALVRNMDVNDDQAFDTALGTGDVTPPFLDELRRRVEANQLALEMLDRGSKLTGCNYDLQLRYGIAVMLPKLNTIRALGKTASLRTRLLAFEGKGDQAIDSAIASLGMLRMLDRQPILVAYLVRIGCTTLFCKDIELILEKGRPSAEKLATLEQSLKGAEQGFDLATMFRAERVYSMELMRDVLVSTRALAPANAAAPLMAERGSFQPGLPVRWLVARTLPVHEELIRAAQKGWPQALEDAKGISKRPRSRWDSLAAILQPALERAMKTTAQGLVQLRSTAAAVRIERYRLQQGRLPDSLDQLPNNQAFPPDPFTGKSLVYAKTPDGYAVYSVGEAGKDLGFEKVDSARGPHYGIRIQMSP